MLLAILFYLFVSSLFYLGNFQVLDLDIQYVLYIQSAGWWMESESDRIRLIYGM